MSEREKGSSDKGVKAEQLACEWLTEQGLRVVAKNWRCRNLELDIIAIGPLLNAEGRVVEAKGLDGGEFLHIVEVRSRGALNKAASSAGDLHPLVEPELTIDIQKQRNIINAANAFVRRFRISQEVVFDVVAVVYLPSGPSLRYIPNAFIPLW